MELICNELSFFPPADDIPAFENRLTRFFETFSVARSEHKFTHVRFSTNYPEQIITTESKFGHWLYSTESRSLRILVLTWLKRPFCDELDDSELEDYISTNYTIQGEGCPITETPFGLAIAAIRSVPAISLDSHSFWLQQQLQIARTIDGDTEPEKLYVYNLSNKSQAKSEDFKAWLNIQRRDQIETHDDLRTYLGFSQYSVVFQDSFWLELLHWKSFDFGKYDRVLVLMRDVERNPFTGGIGRTENLRNRDKEASKRITRDHRLSYSIDADVVTFLACKGHYEFHVDNS